MLKLLSCISWGLFILAVKVEAADSQLKLRSCENFFQPISQSVKKLAVLITAGATKEPLDDVRFIANFSSGALGRALAMAAAAQGHQVTLLAPKELPRLAGELPANIELRSFSSTADLQNRLEEAAREKRWDVVIHSAAVADYTPANVASGKIASNQEELTIKLVKTPKLIRSLRSWFGHAFLVGFKLLSGVAAEERYQIALKQIGDCRTNLCVENDLTAVSSQSHQARVVTPEGGAIAVPLGNKIEVGQSLWNFIEKRQNVNWFQTLNDKNLPTQLLGPQADQAATLLQFAQEAGLLPNNSGNVSLRLADGQYAITPRGVDKSKLQAADFMVAQADLPNQKIFVNSTVKPSIDSSVAAALYAEYPNLMATLHSHSPWFLGAVATKFPFPCGVKEEAQEIINTLKNSSHHDQLPFVVKLIEHGFILGLNSQLTPEVLRQQWLLALADQQQHWNEVQVNEKDLSGGYNQAILAPSGVVGTIRVHADGTISPRLLPQFQRLGYGQELIAIIKAENKIIKTVNECQVLKYYQDRGFKILKQEGRSIFLKAGL